MIEEVFTCQGCKLIFPVIERNFLFKGKTQYEFCEFCSKTFVCNAVMYPTEPSNKAVLATIAISHNLIMREIENLKKEIKK